MQWSEKPVQQFNVLNIATESIATTVENVKETVFGEKEITALKSH